MLADGLGPGDEGGDLLLLLHLPVDIGFDVRVIDVDGDHLRRTARRAARLDGAGRAITDLQETHQAGGLAAAGQAFTLAAHLGRSEEHTSELQSLMRISYAVFCLKKKTNTQTQTS